MKTNEHFYSKPMNTYSAQTKTSRTEKNKPLIWICLRNTMCPWKNPLSICKIRILLHTLHATITQIHNDYQLSISEN